MGIICSLLVVLCSLLQAAVSADAATTAGYKTFYEQYPDRAADFLGAAQYFSIFARNVTLTTNTNGNVAAENFSSSDQGFDIWRGREETDLTNHDDNYLKHITDQGIASSSGNDKTSRFYLGSDVLYSASKDGRPTVAGKNLDAMKATQIFVEDSARPFIDFDAEFAKLFAASREIADYTPDITIDSNDYFRNSNGQVDLNNRVIDVGPVDKQAVVIRIDASVLETSTPLIIQSLETSSAKKEVFIDVDTHGQENATVNSQIVLKYLQPDGSQKERSETEVMDFTDSTILWTFTTNGEPLPGLIVVNRPWMGGIVAPAASLMGTSNIQGSIIVDTFKGSGSTYRWDWQGTAGPGKGEAARVSLSVEKYDKSNGQRLEAANLSGMQFQLTQYDDAGSAVGAPLLLTEANQWAVSDLAAGTYGIRETNAPIGYQTESTELRFSIDDANQLAVETGQLIVSPQAVPAENRSDLFYVEQNQLHVMKYDEPVAKAADVPLPSTGGSGIVRYVVIGGSMIGSVILCRWRKTAE